MQIYKFLLKKQIHFIYFQFHELVLTFLVEAKNSCFVLLKDFFTLHSRVTEYKKEKIESKKNIL